ncbi:MAG: PTS system mannose/fructose/sorbose family transporter subunit IID [Synergistaceae bacterium]|nr:PTS system mannose/fructose/sorbose family transporter subunit IID [Synergistaceae bacterium]
MTTNSKITRKEFWQSYRRSCSLDASWNYERMQNLAFAYMMIPIIKAVCKTKEDIANALRRHLEFFSTTPHICTLLVGIMGAMEEANQNGEDFDESSINAVKASLMGPMAGIGDSLIWGTLRVIAAGIAISFSLNGSAIGPILFFAIINVPCFALRYFCLKQGLQVGTNFLLNMSKTNIMQRLTEGTSILGLMVIGSMVSSMIYFELTMQVGSGDFAQPMQDYLNEIMPGILPLAAFGVMYYLLDKKFKTTTLLAWIFALSVIGKYFGVL